MEHNDGDRRDILTQINTQKDRETDADARLKTERQTDAQTSKPRVK